ncbi:hypothetical protein [Pseudochryseolinea flava]|uniref:Uncharacterized protein n=1 Tax=Pseudochryseolinea flava TaxID=2059302 RepID=A0A364YC29_9BACT|nr:hypothetical protein [Pseudochryseolinea flava]RAW03298.1 hypothetical protein DQQ10_04230 [Pseudochryseolinea flava]
MTTINQKHQILASLDSLDQVQTEKVLAYIQGLLSTSKKDADYRRFKREAIKEIRQALGNSRPLKLSF